jgi:excisionase family DNA binding protein
MSKKEDRMEKLYDCKQVAERYGVKITTVWEWIKTGKLKAVKIGRLYRVTEEALMSFEA